MDLLKKIVQFQVEEDANSLLMDVLPGVLHQVPEDIEKVLKADTYLLARWNKLTPIQRNEWICWVSIVKKEETRAEHIQQMIEDLKEGKRKTCFWPGCPHRKPSAQKRFKKAEI